MVKLLQKSLREYRGVSILTPILVSLEVVMECIIPFITARLVNESPNFFRKHHPVPAPWHDIRFLLLLHSG